MNTEGDTKAVSLPVMEVSIERPALYVVATPIGNLGDLGLRAAHVLAGVDLVLSEDTRHTRGLLEAWGIATPMRAVHDHNERRLAAPLIAEIQRENLACALVSDAGTPLISDPGFALVREAAHAGLRMLAVPGPNAAVAALSVAGIATDRFVFEGFLPARAGQRDRRLADLAREPRTLVFYEAPHRIERTVVALVNAFGAARECALARELTKTFESVYRGTLAELSARLAAEANAGRGELVLVVAGAALAEDETLAEAERVLAVLLEHTDRRSALAAAAALTGAPRNRLYEAALRLGANAGDGDVEI